MNNEYPQQYNEFRNVIEEMMELHLKKSQDYSPWNVNGVGEVGVAVRLWDKVARLMNLLGWDLSSGKLNVAKNPKNESLDDTLIDLASYAVIMIVLRRGKWGK